jgi:mannose-6-phosphate isomerase
MTYPNLLPLKGVVQDYAWGGYHFIPELQGEDSAEGQPQAELWMGAHDRGPSIVQLNGKTQRLDEWINADPEAILGEPTAQRFHNTLPFLFKILDVRKMLSIQAHPTKQAAIAGFERENKRGISLTAYHRNYKDDNHKPEIMVALTDFWLLHGFRTAEDIELVLEEVPELNVFRRVFIAKGIRGLYRHLMELSQDDVDRTLAPMAARLEADLSAGVLERSQPEYWAGQAFRDYTRDGHYDRGIFSIYLFNLVYLQAGEGIFQDANIPHAYLEGVNVELMANSDNVFRGGLTSKHVDVGELMQHLSFEPVIPQPLQGEEGAKHEKIFKTPAPDFELSRIQLAAGEVFSKKQRGPAIYIVLSGEINSEIGPMGKGNIWFSPDGAEVEFSGVKEAIVFKAGVPL